MSDSIMALIRPIVAAALLFAPFWVLKGSTRIAIEPGDGSMTPSGYPDGGYFVETNFAQIKDLKPGDVIAYKTPTAPEKPRVARILALEGATVEVNEKGAFVNGKLERPVTDIGPYRVAEFRVPEGCLFVLADLSMSAMDSMQIGPLPLNNVVGRLKPAH